MYLFFWVFPRRQIVIFRRFGTICQFHLQRLWSTEWVVRGGLEFILVLRLARAGRTNRGGKNQVVGGQSGWVSVEGGGISGAFRLLWVEWFARFSFSVCNMWFIGKGESSFILLFGRSVNLSTVTRFRAWKPSSCLFPRNCISNSTTWSFIQWVPLIKSGRSVN
jgi:hypothetical protein